MKKLVMFCLLAVALAAIIPGCNLLGVSGNSDEEATITNQSDGQLNGSANNVPERPACLEQRSVGGAQVVVICGTEKIFTYLVPPEITVNFSKSGFDVSPYITYGPAVNVEGVEVQFSPHPRAGGSPKTVILGSKGGFAKKSNSDIYVTARSFVSDRQGHKFFTKLSPGIKYR
jgi:hypothetical protein